MSLERTEEDCFRMAVFALNWNVGSEGIRSMLLVFGAIPSPARKKPSATQIERADMATKIERADMGNTDRESRYD